MAQSIDPSDRPACRPGQPCRMVGLRVLVVDDDAARLMRKSRALARHGFRVLTAADPGVAVATLRTGVVCDIVVVELERGARAAVGTINALRGLRAWLPAVIVGSAAPPEGARLVDPYVKTKWLPQADEPSALFRAILDASCPGHKPEYCPFARQAGPVRHSTDPHGAACDDWMAAASGRHLAARMIQPSAA